MDETLDNESTSKMSETCHATLTLYSTSTLHSSNSDKGASIKDVSY